MLSIGNKKYRNLQEQVAYNTECIKKLDEYLDGISIQDKLVVIANDSGTFTEEELETLSMPLAFIANASKVWIKSNETDSELLYKAVDIEATEVESVYFKIGGSKITINKLTREFIISEDEIITIYNKSQIDSIVNGLLASLDGKANLSGANFTGDVTAKTLEQSEPNFSIDLSEVNPTIPGDFSVENIFSRLQVINKELEVIFTFKITNTGTATATPTYVQLGIFDIPEEIGAHILDIEGNDLTTTPTSEKAIAGSALVNTTIAGSPTHNVFTQRNGTLSLSHNSQNKMRIACYTLSSMPSGSETVYSGRIQLTLL